MFPLPSSNDAPDLFQLQLQEVTEVPSEEEDVTFDPNLLHSLGAIIVSLELSSSSPTRVYACICVCTYMCVWIQIGRCVVRVWIVLGGANHAHVSCERMCMYIHACLFV